MGHAWIYLQGIQNGQRVFIEGGHSGELGCRQAKYFDGIMNYIDYGYSSPTPSQMRHPKHEPNPIKYLWEKQKDGFFQLGSGGHIPIFAAKIDLTPEQFEKILHFIQNYPYSEYCITDNQCSTFVVQAASLASFPIQSEVTICIDQTLTLGGETFKLWEDPRYSMLTFASPDAIEASLIRAVYEGRAQDALAWYKKRHQPTFNEKVGQICESVTRLPERLYRVMNLD